MVTDRHTSICTSRDPVFKILAESRRSRVRSKIKRGAFQAQIAMYYPSEPVSMAQTNRQRHSATMAVHGYGSAHLNLHLAWSSFQDFARIEAVSGAFKNQGRCLPCPSSNVLPFRASVHGPNKQTKALSNNGSPWLRIGTPQSALRVVQFSRFCPNRGRLEQLR